VPDDRAAVPLAGRLLAPHGADLVVGEWTDSGGGSDPPMYMAPLHVHHRDDEAWYILEGTLAFRLGADEHKVPAGGALVAPRGTPHTFWNPSREPARYVIVMTRRIKALIDAVHALPTREPGAMEALFREYESEIVSWP
jgi:mannose-6-phosphate isomerase-like protein (cupin superfamily)